MGNRRLARAGLGGTRANKFDHGARAPTRRITCEGALDSGRVGIAHQLNARLNARRGRDCDASENVVKGDGPVFKWCFIFLPTCVSETRALQATYQRYGTGRSGTTGTKILLE